MANSNDPVGVRFHPESDADLLEALKGAPNRSARIKALMRAGLQRTYRTPVEEHTALLFLEEKDSHKIQQEDLEEILAGSGFDGI